MTKKRRGCRWLPWTMYGMSLCVLCCWTAPRAASAETSLQAAIRICPNGRAIAVADKKQQEAAAIAALGPSFDKLVRSTALEEYRCYQAVHDPYVAELMHIYYAQDMLIYLIGRSELSFMGPNLANEMNDLAASTRYPDLASLAKRLRDRIRARVSTATVTPEPAALPESVAPPAPAAWSTEMVNGHPKSCYQYSGTARLEIDWDEPSCYSMRALWAKTHR